METGYLYNIDFINTQNIRPRKFASVLDYSLKKSDRVSKNPCFIR